MTDHDFTEMLNAARARGFVARMLHPLVLVVTTPEYAAVAPGIAGEKLTSIPLDLPPASPPVPASAPH